MFNMYILRTVVFLTAFSFMIGVGHAFACGCGAMPQPTPANREKLVQRILDKAEYVFIGKVAAFEYRKGILNSYMEDKRITNPLLQYETKFVKLSVERWWKGPLGAEASLQGETKNSDGTGSGNSCDVGFKEGETYIVSPVCATVI